MLIVKGGCSYCLEPFFGLVPFSLSNFLSNIYYKPNYVLGIPMGIMAFHVYENVANKIREIHSFLFSNVWLYDFAKLLHAYVIKCLPINFAATNTIDMWDTTMDM